MEIRKYTDFKEDEIVAIYDSVGWTAYTQSVDSLMKGIENSMLVFGAFEDGRLVGLVRAVGDGYTVVIIQDILVRPEYQGRGVGKALMKVMLDNTSHVRQVQLVTDDTEKTLGFYKSLGFADIGEFGCKALMLTEVNKG